MTLPNISAGASVSQIEVAGVDFDIFRPSVPSRSSTMKRFCGRCPTCSWSSRPTSRLNCWSVPPSSTSASIATES